MLQIQFAELKNTKLAYQMFGNSKIDIVIEMGLGSCIGEWAHIAQNLSSQYTVLLYERAGIDLSDRSKLDRTPKNIAVELHELLQQLPHKNEVILIAHSQGGLYAQQFARLYPDMVKGLILLDPLSASDRQFCELLSKEEYRKSGVDKSSNLKMMRVLAKLHLGGALKKIMKKAPPFYYYDKFEKEAADNILNALTKESYYKTLLDEYSLSHMETSTAVLKTNTGFPDIPLILITHDSDMAIIESMQFGRNKREFAASVEDIWQGIMMEYLTFSKKSCLIRAEKSGHFIHLTEPELINEGIDLCNDK